MGLAVLFATLGAINPAVLVQEPAATPRVTLVQSVGPPGGSVSMPIQLTGIESASLGSLTLQVSFTTARLTFTKVSIGGIGEAAALEISASTQQRGSETLLTVKISTREQDGVRGAIPDGPVAQLLFTLAKDLKPETVVRLKTQASGTTLKGDAAPPEVAAADGEIIVSNPPVIGCFFYMH